jgi:tetratricopeptide (TPR) repeat protein
MVKTESATTPLDFAYCSVKRLPAYHLYLLQEVALQYGNHGTTDDADKAVAILDEVRQDQRRGLQKYRNMIVYPRLAADYHAIGRPDLAIDILDETIQHSRSLLVRWEASIYAYVATVCNDIGEHERCNLLLRKVTKYVDSVPRFSKSIVESYWLGDLLSLYLRLGMVDAAESLAFKMSGNQRTESVLTLAFHGQPVGQCNESLLVAAIRRPSESGMALVAGFFIQNGQFARASTLLDQITQSTYLRHEPLLQLVKCMLQRGDDTGALELLDRLLATPRAVSIHSNHLNQICELLHDSHGDMHHRVLVHVSMSVEKNTRRLTLLEYMAKRVGFLAPHSLCSAEAAVDQLFDACVVEIERGKGNACDMSMTTVPVSLHRAALTIDRHGLRWDEQRRERFRLILGRIPVPQRFEYRDLFRPQIAV